jgi:hypothetical protein
VIVLLGLVALRGVLLGIGAALIVRPVIECPACFAATSGLYHPWLRRIVPWLEWRFCVHCGWSGPGRRVVSGTGSQRSPGASRRQAVEDRDTP